MPFVKPSSWSLLFYLMVITLVIGFGLIFHGIFYVVNEGVEIKEYCLSQGWDGYDDTGKCYRYVPHPSGTGYLKEYSGVIVLD